MNDKCADIMGPQSLTERLGHGDTTVASTGASDRNRQEVLVFTDKTVGDKCNNVFVATQEFLGTRLIQYVIADRVVLAAEGTQRVDPERIREKPHIGDHIGVDGNAVFEPE